MCSTHITFSQFRCNDTARRRDDPFNTRVAVQTCALVTMNGALLLLFQWPSFDLSLFLKRNVYTIPNPIVKLRVRMYVQQKKKMLVQGKAPHLSQVGFLRWFSFHYKPSFLLRSGNTEYTSSDNPNVISNLKDLTAASFFWSNKPYNLID